MGDLVDDRESFTVTTYLADKERNIRLIRWLLKSICLWPGSSNASIVDRIFSELLRFMCCSVLLITIVSIGLFVFIEDRKNEIDTMMINIGPFITYSMALLKYICLVLRVDDIRSCVNCMELDWNIVRSNEDYEVMLKDAKIGRFIAAFIAAFVHIAIQSLNVTNCLSSYVMDIDNVTMSFHKLPYAFYSEIMNVRSSPQYEIVVIMQFVSSFIVGGIIGVNCGLMATFVMHACAQLKILTLWLGDIVHDESIVDVNSVQKKLGFIVEQHLRVIK